MNRLMQEEKLVCDKIGVEPKEPKQKYKTVIET